MDVYVAGKRVRIDPAQMIGKGGEAEVHPYGAHQVLKVFKTPDHPDLHGQRAEQDAARDRLDEHQRKLRAFPAALPPEVVVPLELATDRRGKQVLGYTMRRISHAEPLLRLSDPLFRRAFTSDQVRDTFLRLHGTVNALHQRGITLGDFNDLNVLVDGNKVHVIDADSFQFSSFLSRVFTERFLDPLHMAKDQPVLARPYTPSADWFAFCALLMQSLLLVGPWGGIHRPKPGTIKVPPPQRPLQRLSVLHPEVQYPRPARPLSSLPDSLLAHLEEVLHQDLRTPLPLVLLQGLRFTRCTACGLEHARDACPTCRPSATAPQQPVVSVRGTVTARPLLFTEGVVVFASVHQGTLRAVVHDRGGYRDESGAVVLGAPLSPEDRFLSAGELWHHRRGALRSSSGMLSAESATTNGRELFWTTGGALHRRGALGPERVGNIIDGQTHFGVGPRFGLGFYRAGNCTVLFTFRTTGGGLREDTQALRLSGAPVQIRFAASDTHGWLLVTTRAAGRLEHQLLAVDEAGNVLGRSSGSPPAWLELLQADPVAVGPWLFVPTDGGIVRVELQHGSPAVTREFPDTASFVDAATPLLFDGSGLLAVQPRRILKLQMQ